MQAFKPWAAGTRLFLAYVAHSCNQSAGDWNCSYEVWFSFSQGRWKRWEERHLDWKQRTPGVLMEQACQWVTPVGRWGGHEAGNWILLSHPCTEWYKSWAKWSGIAGDVMRGAQTGRVGPACLCALGLTSWHQAAGELVRDPGDQAGSWGDLLAQLRGDRSCKREASLGRREENLCMQMRRERRLAVGEYQVRETISNQEDKACV